MQLTVATWNINSVRLRIDAVAKFVKAARPDVLCLQETKCPDDKFPRKRFKRLGYEHMALNGQKGYHGVVMLSLLPFDSVIATATLTADAIGQAIVRGVTRGPIPVVSGIEVEVTCNGNSPHATLLRDGHPIAPDTRLSVITSEFLSAGGAGYFPDMEKQFTLQLDTPMRESVVAALKGQQSDLREGRAGSHDPAHKRIRLPGGAFPVRCEVPARP